MKKNFEGCNYVRAGAHEVGKVAIVLDPLEERRLYILKKIGLNAFTEIPVDTRRCFNVDTTSYDFVSTLKQRRVSTEIL